MGRVDELEAEVKELRERLSNLSGASLRINESLDFETVLQEVLDSARSLTGARFGLMLIYENESGWIANSVVSGVSPGQVAKFQESPERVLLRRHFDEYSEAVRIRDLNSYIKEQDLPEPPLSFPANSAVPLLSVPIHYRGERCGTVYLAGKLLEPTSENGMQEFTADDQETLILFATQAALVISNARRHRDESRARADLETLVNSVPVGVMVFDAHTRTLTSVNREVERIAGDLLPSGGSVQDLLDVAVFRDAEGRVIPPRELPVARVLRSGEALQAEEITIDTPDGQSVTAVVNATPIRTVEDKVESVVVSVQDMTPVIDLDRLRAEFLAIVGHELRTPLTSIKGSAATLIEAESTLAPAEVSEYHRLINEQADYMRGLIGDLIDVVRIETGMLSVNPMPVELHRMVDEARSTVLSAGGRENIRVKLSPDLPPVMADKRRIVQVVNNLLINASRNSYESSPIRVEGFLDGVHVAVSVSDEGRGVPAERLPHLFKKFSHMEGQENGRDLGLGLAICKGIVEAHGGRIWAESDGLGMGSRFTFTIPVSDQTPPLAAADRVDAPSHWEESGEQARVLAVDDDPRTLKHVRDTLARAGFAPTVTGDPEQVASLMEQNEPNVVLLDMMLPGSDGIELMQEVLALSDVPVIFLSAYDQDELIANAFEMGAVDYIVKPFSPSELAARVKAALRERAS